MHKRNELLEFAEIVRGHTKGTVSSTKLSLGGFQVATCVSRQTTFNISPIVKANAPHTVESYKQYMMDASNGFTFELSKSVKYNERLAKLITGSG